MMLEHSGKSSPRSFIDALDQTIFGVDDLQSALFRYIEQGNEKDGQGWLKEELKPMVVPLQRATTCSSVMYGQQVVCEIVVILKGYAAGSKAVATQKEAICNAFDISQRTSQNYTQHEMNRLFGTTHHGQQRQGLGSVVEKTLNYKGNAHKVDRKRKTYCALPFVLYLEERNKLFSPGWLWGDLNTLLVDELAKPPEAIDDIAAILSALLNGLDEDGPRDPCSHEEKLLVALGWTRSDLVNTIRRRMKRLLPSAFPAVDAIPSHLFGYGDLASRIAFHDHHATIATPRALTSNTRAAKKKRSKGKTPKDIRALKMLGLELASNSSSGSSTDDDPDDSMTSSSILKRAFTWLLGAPEKLPKSRSATASRQARSDDDHRDYDYASIYPHSTCKENTPAKVPSKTPAKMPASQRPTIMSPTTIPAKTPARKQLSFDIFDSSHTSTSVTLSSDEDITVGSAISRLSLTRGQQSCSSDDDDPMVFDAEDDSNDAAEDDGRVTDDVDGSNKLTGDGNELDVDVDVDHELDVDHDELDVDPESDIDPKLDVDPELDVDQRLQLLADLDVYIKQLKQAHEGRYFDIDLSSLVVKYLFENAKKEKQRIFALDYKDERGRMRTKLIVDIPSARGRAAKIKSKTSLDRLVLDKTTNLLLPILKIICTDEDFEQQKAIVLKLLHQVNPHDERFRVLTVDECITIQQLAGISTNKLAQILGILNRILGMKITPPQLRAAIAKREKENALPVHYFLVNLPTSKDKNENCLFWYHPDVIMIIERMYCDTVLANAYEDSFSFSNHVNSLIYFYGLDRGGGDCVLLLRLGNRKDGNKGTASFPLAVAEKAAEVAATLDQFYRGSVIGPNLQIMIDKQLHMLDFVWYMNKSDNDEHHDDTDNEDEDEDDDCYYNKDARCIAFEFVYEGECSHGKTGHNRYHGASPAETDAFVFHPKNLQVHTTIGKTITLQSEEDFDGTSPHDRHLPVTVSIKTSGELLSWWSNAIHPFDWLPNFGRLGALPVLPITVSLVQCELTNTNDCKNDDGNGPWYIGCTVLSSISNRVMASFRFDQPMRHAEEYFKIGCKGVMAMPAQDGKMEVVMQGIATCNDSFPCPICLKASKDFADVRTEATLRTGAFSNHYLYQIYKSTQGQGRMLSTTVKPSSQALEYCKSVTSPPLLRNPVEDLSGDAMHISQGNMTHLSDETLIHLHRIDAKSSFMSDLKSAQATAEATCQLLESSHDFLALRRQFQQLHKTFSTVCKSFNDSASTGDSAAVIHSCVLERADQHLKLMEARSQETGYGTANLLIRGYKEFSEQVKLAIIELEKPKSKLFGQSEFVFRRAVTIMAKSFNKQHGSRELTNGAGITALEHRKEIHGFTSLAYDGVNDELNREVKMIMEHWMDLADLLYPLSKSLKRQTKWAAAEIDVFEQQIHAYITKWKSYTTKQNPVFWKMHMMLHLVKFVKRHGFIGRGSAEGFEGKHYDMSKLKDIVATMVLDAERIGVISRRQQLILDPKITSLLRQFGRPTRAKRGQYKRREGLSRREENLVVQEDHCSAEAGYFQTQKNHLLPIFLKEMYEYCVYKKVPESWARPFEMSSALGSSAKAKAEYMDC